MALPNSDWFVVAGSGLGDGSREKPFHDPWLAFRSASPGDRVHIAAGTYFGRYDRSSWIVDCPRLTVCGGYSRDFSSRTPWQTPSVFAVFAGYEYPRENNLICGQDDHSGLILDGLVFDASGGNTYGPKPDEGVRTYPIIEGPTASFNAAEVILKNCTFINSANGGVQLSGSGSRFENNLLLNMIGLAMLELRSSSKIIEQPIIVEKNSFGFIHDIAKPAGAGADNAIGVRINCPAVVQDNLFVSCGNAALSLFVDPGRVTIERNLFYLTPRDLLVSRQQGTLGEITEKNLEELEDIGIKAYAGNAVQDPGMTGLRPEWLNAYSRHLFANYGKAPRESANAVRVSFGLPALNPVDLDKPEKMGALAPRLTVADAQALRSSAVQGSHSLPTPVEIPAGSLPAAPQYRPVGWEAFNAPDPSLANQPVELRAGLGGEQNVALLSETAHGAHAAIRLFRPGTDDSGLFVSIPRFTLAYRQYQEAVKYNRGPEVESSYLVRGICRTDVEPSSRQKATLLVESIIPAALAVGTVPPRPQGRDWFVRSGSTGGDGTREKPFRDPFQALDKAEGGDAIHVAAGDYFGKLHSGQWRISVRHLSLLGGYNPDFSLREPWTNPTRFLLHEDEKAKGTPNGTLLLSEENSEGLILDGFIFDGAGWNSYRADGSLEVANSPLAPLIRLRGARAPLTVRNCLFVNGSSGAVVLSCPLGVFENNLVLNTSGAALAIRAEGPGPWKISDNTLLFAADPTDRAGTGKSSSDGTLLELTGRAVFVVTQNIFAFADQFGVRSAVPQQNVSFDQNVFAANLFNHLTDAHYLWTDASNLERRAGLDSAFASFAGNTLELPRLEVDPSFAEKALARLCSLPSRISKEEWTDLGGRIGSSARPVDVVKPPDLQASKSAASGGSLTDLLAQLSSVQSKLSQAQASAAPKPWSPTYCPKFDWRKALALAPATEGWGARRRPISVVFSAPRPQIMLQYARISPPEIGTSREALDNKPVELEVTDLRNSSTDNSLFPPGTDKNGFDAFSVTAPQAPSRIRIALIVKMDTTASKMVGRSAPTDTLRVRGIARITGDPYALSIVVDTVEAPA